MKKRLRIVLFLLGILGLRHSFSLPAMNIQDKASLQRGAALFINYCSGCHSLKYLRYEQMSKDLAIPLDLLKNNLIFTESKVDDPILIALAPEDAQEWFGVVPPDLSLSGRQRGKIWLYRYLTGFYKDNTRPFGVNNTVLPNAAMPDILESLRARPVLMHSYHESQQNNKQKEMLKEHFEQQLGDLINFLEYVGEPAYFKRRQLGPFVLIFFIILLIPVYCLKRLYWSKGLAMRS